MTERKDHCITQLKQGESATVAALHGGNAMQQRMRSVGINEGKKVTVVANHPFSGPLVVQAGGRQITLGRGMARRIIVTPEQ